MGTEVKGWKLAIPGLLLSAAMTTLKVWEGITGASLAHWGVFPRNWAALPGIFLSPLIHGSGQHLISNLIPLILLTAGVRLLYPGIAFRVMAFSYVLPGMYVWIAARPSYHIGASGMVYALAFFLMLGGLFRREAASAAVALAVVSLYGGIVWGLLPIDPGISWESHVYGALVGAILGFFYRKKDRIPRKTYDWQQEPEYPEATGVWDYRRQVPPETKEE